MALWVYYRTRWLGWVSGRPAYTRPHVPVDEGDWRRAIRAELVQGTDEVSKRIYTPFERVCPERRHRVGRRDNWNGAATNHACIFDAVGNFIAYSTHAVHRGQLRKQGCRQPLQIRRRTPRCPAARRPEPRAEPRRLPVWRRPAVPGASRALPGGPARWATGAFHE